TNPVKNLTIAQLKNIYTGKVTDWKDVGGKKGAIVVVSRDTTSGTHEAWSELVLNHEPVVRAASPQISSQAVLEKVATTPDAIGYDGIDYVEGNSRVKSVSVDGVKPSAATVSTSRTRLRDRSICSRAVTRARPLSNLWTSCWVRRDRRL